MANERTLRSQVLSGVQCVYAGLVIALLVLGAKQLYTSWQTRVAIAEAPDAIRAVLASQESAWNAKDLDGFMAGYWRSDDLKFLSDDDVTTGWQATYDRYHAKYVAGDNKMGKLTFTVLDVDVVSSDAAIVRGRWALVKPDGSTPHGLFTLLFRRIDGEWKIVSDHTSAAEK